MIQNPDQTDRLEQTYIYILVYLQMSTCNRLHINFIRLSKILSLVSKQSIEGGVNIRGDMRIPKQYLCELNQIKIDLKRVGGKCRTRTKHNDKLKTYFDLLVRVGDLTNQRVSRKISRVTIGKHANGTRIQTLAYNYQYI